MASAGGIAAWASPAPPLRSRVHSSGDQTPLPITWGLADPDSHEERSLRTFATAEEVIAFLPNLFDMLR